MKWIVLPLPFLTRNHLRENTATMWKQQMSRYDTKIENRRWFVTQLNTLKPKKKGHQFPDDILKCIFLNENIKISIKVSLKFVPMGLINNIPALAQIMSWCRPGAKISSEPMTLVYWCIHASLGLNVLNDNVKPTHLYHISSNSFWTF